MVMTTFPYVSILILTILTSCGTKEQDAAHLLILSGQSNMQGLQPNDTFIPLVDEAFGKENVIVVKDAKGGQPIRRWYKKWKSIDGTATDSKPDLYDSLLGKVRPNISNRKIESVTFIWMQGERDAREEHGEVYEESLLGLYQQLTMDLGRTDINFLIGRLSDFDMENAKYPHWTMIRKIQEKVAKSNPRFALIDTDDLNDGMNAKGMHIKDDLHMSEKGYHIMGQRFAKKAIELINLQK